MNALGFQLTERYRPHVLDDIVGIQTQKAVAQNFMKHWLRKRPYIEALLFVGEKGTGKTSLAFALANEHDVPITVTDAGDERKMKDLMRLEKMSIIGSLSGSVRLIVIDEVDSIPKKSQQRLVKIIEKSTNPIVLIANDDQKLIPALKKSCQLLQFELPSLREKKELLKKIIDQEGLNTSKDEQRKIIEGCDTMRAIVVTLQSGLADEGDRFGNEFEQVAAILQGESIHLTLQPHDLAIWIYDNSDDHELVALADRMTGRARVNYNMWRYSFELLKMVRKNGTVRFPRTFILMGKYKRLFNKKPKATKKPAKKPKVVKTDVMIYKEKIHDEGEGLGAFFV